jgi:hypothetical protein
MLALPQTFGYPLKIWVVAEFESKKKQTVEKPDRKRLQSGGVTMIPEIWSLRKLMQYFDAYGLARFLDRVARMDRQAHIYTLQGDRDEPLTHEFLLDFSVEGLITEALSHAQSAHLSSTQDRVGKTDPLPLLPRVEV